MQHDDAVYLRHILETARKAVHRAKSRVRTDLDEDDDFRDALAHRVQIIGEAASRLTSAFRESHPEIPWPRVIGMRHRIVHDYMNTDNDILWEVAVRSLPELIALLSPLLEGEGV